MVLFPNHQLARGYQPLAAALSASSLLSCLSFAVFVPMCHLVLSSASSVSFSAWTPPLPLSSPLCQSSSMTLERYVACWTDWEWHMSDAGGLSGAMKSVSPSVRMCLCVDSFPSGVSPGVKTPDFPPTQRHAYGWRFPVNDKKESVGSVCVCVHLYVFRDTEDYEQCDILFATWCIKRSYKPRVNISSCWFWLTLRSFL